MTPTHRNWHTGLPCDCPYTAHLDLDPTLAKVASNLDQLKSPKKRPDLQTPEGQKWLEYLESQPPKVDAIAPWMTREWKQGRLIQDPNGPGVYHESRYGEYGQDPQTDEIIRWPYAFDRAQKLGLPNPPELRDAAPSDWADWHHSNHPNKEGVNIQDKNFQVPQMQQKVQEYQDDLNRKEQENYGDVVHRFPDDWTVRRIRNGEEAVNEGRPREQGGMGHCMSTGCYNGSINNGDLLAYSLRDPRNEPHATWDITPQWRTDPNDPATRVPTRPDPSIETILPMIEHLNEQDDDPAAQSMLVRAQDKYGPDKVDRALQYSRSVPILNQGTVNNVFGKKYGADTEAPPEIKDRIKQYMETMPEEERPRAAGSDLRPESPNELTEFHHNPDGWALPLGSQTPASPSEYGLGGSTPKPNYESIMRAHRILGGDMYEGEHEDQGDSIYNIARERGEIPELGQSLGDEQHMQQLLQPHWNPETGQYQNEPYQAPQAPQPQTSFSSKQANTYEHPKFHTTLEDHERAKEQWGLPQAPHKRSAVDPDWLQQFIQQNGPYLHHAADPEAVEAIQRDGLIPHSQLPTAGYDKYKISPDLKPRPGNVYASTHRIMSPLQPHFRIDMRKLDPDRFNPDEDAFNEEHRRFGMKNPAEFGSRGEWAEAYNLGADPRQTAYSLDSLGRMAYQGGIPPEALELENVDDIPNESERPKFPATAKIDEHFPELRGSSLDMRYRDRKQPSVFPDTYDPPNPPQPTTQPTTQPQPTFSHIFNIPAPPPKSQKLGNTTLEWEQTDKGAVMRITGDTHEDRALGRLVLASELARAGIELAQIPMDHDPKEPLGEELARIAGLHKEADWDDVQQKAKRLLDAGNVTLLRNGYNNVVTKVQGDHGSYQNEISRDDPNSRAITGWQCSCPWDDYSFGRCVAEGTLITMADGTARPVESIAIGDAILDHTGSVGIVAETHIEDWHARAIMVKASGFASLVVKPDHPIWGLHKNDVACRTESGDLVGPTKARTHAYCALDSCSCGNPRDKAAEPYFRLADQFEPGDYLVRPHMLEVREQPQLDLADFVDEAEVTEDSIIPTRSFATRSGTQTIARQRKSSFTRHISVTADLLRLVGYYLAEGCCTPYSVRMAFHVDEDEYRDDVADIGRELFGATAKYEWARANPNCRSVSFNNRELTKVFKRLFGAEVGSKQIPGWMMLLPPELQAHLVEGWLRGDGHVRSDGRNQIATVNPRLAYQLELLLQRLGYTPGLVHERRSGRSELNEQDAYTVTWYPQQTYNGGHRFTEANHTFTRIVEAKLIPYQGKMYDLTVVGNPGYIANGFSVHNTRQWKKYEARPCAHTLASYWKSLSSPLDPDVDPKIRHVAPGTLPTQGEPGGGQGMGPGGETQPSFPGMTEREGQPPEPQPGDQTSLFDQAIQRTPSLQNALQALDQAAQPEDAGIIPPNPNLELPEQPQTPQPGQLAPGEVPPPNTISAPGARPITIQNPIQIPSTLSSWQEDNWKISDDEPTNSAFQSGDAVRLEEPTYGVAQGKSEEHGAGGWAQVPRNSIGEVRGQDPTTGWVEAHFPLNNSGPMEPYAVKMFLDPSQVSAVNNRSPFVKRR